MKKILLLLMFVCTAGSALGQTVKGTVYDASTNKPLPGASVTYVLKGNTVGVSTDKDGDYEVNVPAGSASLTFSFLGYTPQVIQIIIKDKEVQTQNIYMQQATEVLDDIVVSAGRYEQPIGEVTVSMEVIKADGIERQNSTDLRAVLNTMPGVEITDKQPSIRGGSGWNYGVGSRSLVLVDGMSILTPGVGEINWNLIPMENIDQMEVIKGASSVLYGSSALNGVINIRTKRPGLEPQTKISAYVGLYGSPAEKSYEWWDKSFWKEGRYDVKPVLRQTLLYGVRNPMYDGLELSHTRRIGNFDVSAALNLFADEGYRQGGYNKRVRYGGNVTYHDQKVENLNYGINLNGITNEYGDFFIWRSPKNAYVGSPLSNMGRQHNMFYVDPFLNYYNDCNKTTHRLKGRFFYKSDNIIRKAGGRNLLEIFRDMGVDGNSIGQIVDLVSNPSQLIGPIVPPLLHGDVNGIVDVIKGYAHDLFPNAGQESYVDLISWLMNNGIPTSTNDIPTWALNTLCPQDAKTEIDNTYSGYVDYQFSKRFRDESVLTSGVTYEHLNVNSTTSGDHVSDNIALFTQYDRKFFDRLNMSLGVRFEYYRVDDMKKEAETKVFGLKVPFKPVIRGGLNYQLADYTYLRASFGQGYRYPSITEKFIVKDIGGAGAYPNPELKPEKGYNVEIGLKQGYRFGPFKGYFDIAGFYTEYSNMIEFNIGLLDPDPAKGYPFVTGLNDVVQMLLDGHMPAIGVKFSNVNKARIYGGEFSMNGFCDIRPDLKMVYSLGYTYLEPRDVNYKQRNAEEEANTDLFAFKSKSNNSKYLKYRQKHSIKGTFDFMWNRISLGVNLGWKSKTLAVDYLMADERVKAEPNLMDHVRSIVFGDLDSYWKNINKGYFLMDFRFGVKVTNQVDFQYTINNLLNEEYCVRPMDVSPPRTHILRMNISF